MEKGKIGENLKKIRSEKKLTQRELSDDVDCSEVYISNIERELAAPSAKTIVSMANSLNVPLASIVDRKCEYTGNGKPYDNIFGDLSLPRTVYLLKMVYEVKNKILEYERYKEKKRAMVAEGEQALIDYKSLGETIVRLRMEKELPRTVMAKRLKMKLGTYRNIENNNAVASMDKYMEIASELNVPIDYIFQNSLENKAEISREYIRRIFNGLNDRERRMLTEIARKLSMVFNEYDF